MCGGRGGRRSKVLSRGDVSGAVLSMMSLVSECLVFDCHGVDLSMVEFIETGVALWSHAFLNGCELCDAVQRRYGNVDEAGHGPLASRACKVETTVGGLGKKLL